MCVRMANSMLDTNDHGATDGQMAHSRIQRFVHSLNGIDSHSSCLLSKMASCSVE